ncbi:lipocalin family protein [Paenimyroides baculatum]|uniref:Lipocalin-like domain-containing protein n=1 Tax=Paenimyroides baculatum TaxID=2608000 RepID=A0A5M6CLS1_9FLAO|nr:lipocalin family protein [Paenimyroides baculatum]KAA5535927.1 hypothetical protein F0460_05685 [Paenimyroides baculatum]
MKKLVFFSALLSLSLVSCGDDDKPQPEQQKDTQTLLTAKWNLVKSEYIINGVTETEDLKPGDCDYDYYDLKSGGLKDEISHDESDNCSTSNWPGTWAYNAAKKQVTLVDSDDNYTLVTEVISINATDLKIKLISADGEPAPTGTEVYLYLKR